MDAATPQESENHMKTAQLAALIARHKPISVRSDRLRLVQISSHAAATP
jgi:hypothetical protein